MAVESDRTTIPLGSESGRKQSIVIIPAMDGTPETPGILAFESSADTTGARTRYFTWFDSNGVYRYHTAIPTNQDSDGSTITSGATTTLNNLGTTALNAALIPGAATIDLGTDAAPFRTEHLLTSLVLNQTTANYTLTWDNPAAARAISIPDPLATATIMLNAGSANTISYTNGTSTITFAANADLDIATNVTVNIDAAVTLATALTTSTEAITLNQSLSTTDAVTFTTITGTTFTDGTATLTAGGLTGLAALTTTGAIAAGTTLAAGTTVTCKGIVNTTTAIDTTAQLQVGADNVYITLGTDDSTDSRISFNATSLCFWDSDTSTTYTLRQLATGTTLNPTVSGDLTVLDGKFTWTDAAAEAAGVWTFAGTSTIDIAVTSSITTGSFLTVTAGAATEGNIISLTANAVTTGTMLYLETSAATFTGYYLRCYDGGANDFSIGLYGATVIAGNAIATAALTLTNGDAVLSSGRLLVTQTGDNTSKFARNVTTLTSAVLEVENTHVSGGVCLLLDQDATGDLNACEITNAGTGFAVTTTAAATAGGGYEYIAATSGIGYGVHLDGTTGSWIGANDVGLLTIDSDGVLAAGSNLLRVTSSGLNAQHSWLVEIEQTGKVVAATDGICLNISETAAATATSYAVHIASTNNEALHVDTGTSLFDETVTISTTSTEGVALIITHPDTGSNTNAVEINPSGSGAGILISPQEADTVSISIVGKTLSSVPAIKIDGSAGDGWIGAATTGLIHVTNDGALAATTTSLLEIINSGVPQDDHLGYCLRIADTGLASAGVMAYPVYITSNDNTTGGIDIATHASGIALNVATGKTDINGPLNIGTTCFFDGTPDTVTNASKAASLTTSVTYLDSTVGAPGAFVATLADGAQGQVKFVCMTADTGDVTFTPANPLGYGTVTFTAIGQTAMFIFLNTKWSLVHSYGTTIA